MNHRKNHWVQLGKIGKPHGLRGGFFISGRESLLPSGVKSLALDPEIPSSRLSIASQRLQGNRPVLFVKEITSPEAAKSFGGRTLWCLRDEINLDDQSEYLWSDLIGSQVFDCKGLLAGTIEHVENYGASDIVTIANFSSSKSLSIPFVKSYVDMNFRPQDQRISLLVDLDLFDDLWEDR